jgi:hypothetical protein
VRNNNFEGSEPQKEHMMNPNEKVKYLKQRYGPSCDYNFLIIDQMQHDFFYEMRSREKKRRKKRK